MYVTQFCTGQFYYSCCCVMLVMVHVLGKKPISFFFFANTKEYSIIHGLAFMADSNPSDAEGLGKEMTTLPSDIA